MKSKCVIIAGEFSADVLGVEIMSAINNIEWYGIGGPLMDAKKLNKIYDWDKISAFGLSDVIFSLPRLYYYASRIADKIIKINPKIIVTVDTKGFNFYLIKLIRQKLKTNNNIPKFIHIVAPTVWAWRANRADKVSKIVDTLLCLFPREPYYFDKNKIEALFIGHPAVQKFSSQHKKSSLLSKLKIKDNGQIVISLLPGSRKKEVQYILPILISVSKLLSKKIRKPILFLCQVAPNQEKLVDQILKKMPNEIKIVHKNLLGNELTSSSDYAIITSGTATLEYALNGIPSIALYKTNFLSAFVGRRLIDMDKIILPNWILGKKYMDFIFQEKCNPEYISEKMIQLIKDKNKPNELLVYAKKLRDLLTANDKTFKENIKNIIEAKLNF